MSCCGSCAGDTNVKYLNEHGVRIWDEWADEHGDLGPVYGQQWRSWPAQDGETIDQIANVRCDDQAQSGFAPADRHRLESGRRRQDGAAAVPLPVPVLRRRWQLSCQLYQRSADVFLGVPFNIASYALLTLMVAQVTGLKARRIHPHVRRRASISQSSRAGAAAAARPPQPLPRHAAQSGGEGYIRFPLRGFRRSKATRRIRISRRRWRCDVT